MQRFQHIYIEKRIEDHPRTSRILAHFPKAQLIRIDSYKDVFNRRGQDPALQHQYQNLILTGAGERNIYPGAPVCQDFGNAHFYYASCAMNCLYDCEYCYLKGMYPSGNLVVIVDLETIMAEAEQLLKRFPVYLCISYDTDLLAMEDLTHSVRAWADFAGRHPDLTIEIRTKCARRDLFELAGMEDSAAAGRKDRFIFAYTISPEEIIRRYEHGTPGLRERLQAAACGIRAGYSVRLCFDPMIFVPDWRRFYTEMLEEAAAALPLDQVRDFSIGSFRISESYLRNMRRMAPASAVVQYPYVLEEGYYHYPDALISEMEEMLSDALRKKVPGAKIWRWSVSG